MKKLSLLLCLIVFSMNSYAYNAGESYGKGVFLYQEPVEIYFNNWSGVILNDPSETNQAEIFIRGEGKTVDFYGVLSANCKNSMSEWISAVNFGQADSESEVPAETINFAISHFCGN